MNLFTGFKHQPFQENHPGNDDSRVSLDKRDSAAAFKGEMKVRDLRTAR